MYKRPGAIGRLGRFSIIGDFGGGDPPDPGGAPDVRQMISVGGDSWTACNEAILSRLAGTPTATDRWDLMASTALGIVHYPSSTQASSSPTGIINMGYGGQSSATIYKNILARIAADADRANDIWTWWSGRNDVTKPGGDVWPSVALGDYSATFTANITSGSTTISGFSPASLAWSDLAISGAGIQAGTTLTVNSAGGAGVLSQVATATTTGVTVTVTARGVKQFLELIPHERKVVFQPYGGGSVTSSISDWIRWVRLRWSYRRLYPKYNFELFQEFINQASLDGTDADLRALTSQGLPPSLTYNSHPNYVTQPKISDAVVPLFRALANNDVYVPNRTIPDVPYDLAVGQTLEVYLKGFCTSVAITTDDPNLPGCFNIAMKPGSNDTALLIRTSVSPGNLSRILNLVITATGKDRAGSTVTSGEAGRIRILPSRIGAASTAAIGATFPLDPNPDTTGQFKRFPRIASMRFPAGPTAGFTFVGLFKMSADGVNMNVFQGPNSNIIINRTSGNKLAIVVKDSAGTTVLNWTTLVHNFNAAAGYCWIAFSIKLDGTPAAHAYACSVGAGSDIDIKAASAAVAGNGLVGNITTKEGFMFTSTDTGYSTFNGAMKMLWIAGQYIDLSIAGNRRLFWNTDGSAVDLGLNGAGSFGYTPDHYPAGHAGDMITGKNFGSAGDYVWNDQWLTGYTSSDPTPP